MIKRIHLPVSLLLAVALSGCVVETDGETRPDLRIETADTVAMDQTLEVSVRFVNTADEAFVAQTTAGCIQIRVWVEVGEQSVLLESRERQQCPGDQRSVAVQPGDSLGWGSFTFRPDEYLQGGAPLFAAGETYTMVADLTETSPPWQVRNETEIQVVEARGDETLHIEVEPEREAFTSGETIAITTRLNNTGDEPFTYTSRDGCNDIHVWVETGEGEEGRVRLYPEMEPYACTQALTEFTIQPGKALEMVVHWDGSASGEGGPPFVSQGSYTLIAKLDGRNELPSGRGDVFVGSPG